MSERIRGLFFLGLVCALVVALDQYTKMLVVGALAPHESREFAPIFNLVLAYNPGAAFGMLATLESGTRGWVLAGTTLIALAVVIALALSPAYRTRAARTALAMILGGALGNIIDRFRIGFVVDFLDFHWRAWHWPAFNAADSAIFIGVVILLLHRAPRPPQPLEVSEPPTPAS